MLRLFVFLKVHAFGIYLMRCQLIENLKKKCHGRSISNVRFRHPMSFET